MFKEFFLERVYRIVMKIVIFGNKIGGVGECFFLVIELLCIFKFSINLKKIFFLVCICDINIYIKLRFKVN